MGYLHSGFSAGGGARLCKLYYGLGTTEDRADVLGCVTLFTDSSILASMLAVIRRHVCESIFGKLEILFRNEVPESCKTPFPVVLDSLLKQLRHFGLEDAQTDVFHEP